MKIIIISGFSILIITLIILHIVTIIKMQGISNELEETKEDFYDEMQLLAETLQVYHELLKDYQIPMIQIPNYTTKNADW